MDSAAEAVNDGGYKKEMGQDSATPDRARDLQHGGDRVHGDFCAARPVGEIGNEYNAHGWLGVAAWNKKYLAAALSFLSVLILLMTD